jgi:RNA polymerase sigma factor (sigma-70 family)
MRFGHLDNFTTSLRKMLGGRQFSASSDGHLLDRFVTHHDESAFEGLMQRHGPLVIGVCRRVLQDSHDVDDAFQATFLVLVRKARSLGRQGSIAGWLYTVAYHIALKAKARAARQRDLQQRRPAMPASTSDEADCRDLRAMLDEELNHLPEKYRAPLVLCYLEGKTNEEAAEALGWTKGTVSGRLARARDLLRGRLVRRGIKLSAPALATALAEEATAAVPIELGLATGKAALLLATGHTLAAIAQPPVVQLVSGAVQRLFLARVRAAAVVLVLLGCLAALTAAMVPLVQTLTNPEPDAARAPGVGPRRVIVVEAMYPGANAKDVAATVAPHIEKQLRGAPGMVHMTAHCMNDGRYLLDVSFPSDVDLDRALSLVQSRVQLAIPQLPEAVQKERVTVKKKAAGVAMIATLSAPARQYDVPSLGNYAKTRLLEPLTRLAGVSQVKAVGLQEKKQLKVRWDPEKLASRNLTPSEVVQALKQANGALAGKLIDLDEINNIPIQADPTIRVRDVGIVKWEPDSNQATLNGVPVVALVIYALPGADARDLRAAVTNKLSELRHALPDGLQLEVAFDFTNRLDPNIQPQAPEYAILDVDLLPVTVGPSHGDENKRLADQGQSSGPSRLDQWQDDPSPERIWQYLQEFAAKVRRIRGVDTVLALTENPFDPTGGRLSVLVRLEAFQTAQASIPKIRAELADTAFAATVRFRDPSWPGQALEWGYPIDLGITGPDAEQARQMAAKFVARLADNGHFIDVRANCFYSPLLRFDINRDAARAEGVAMADIFTALGNSLLVNDFGQFGVLQVDGQYRGKETVNTLKVRNGQGELIPLARFVRVQEVSGRLVLERFNGEPMERITASPKGGVPQAEARRLCETLADEARKELGLSTTYRLVWLTEDAVKR